MTDSTASHVTGSSGTYTVEFVPIGDIRPSPENDKIYGVIEHDETMQSLIESIASEGLEEPIIVSKDGFILSGHRRYYACSWLRKKVVPVRRKAFSRASRLDEWPLLLTKYNPQRVKSAKTLLREAMLKYADNPQQLLRKTRLSELAVTAKFTEVPGIKQVGDIGPRQIEFLQAVMKVVAELKDYWPLSVRTVHYRLLNNPPLTQATKDRNERWRYANTPECYDRLDKLLVPARYYGHVPWQSIDDPTRPHFANEGWFNLSEYIDREMSEFLCEYHRDKQKDQPRHIEVLGEKNTLLQIIKPVCQDYYVPLTIMRGCCSHPVWRDIAARFRASGKDKLSLLILSDHDAAGFDLADDAVRSLRDLWGLPVDYHRVAVEQSQINALGLAEDFNPEKAEGTKLKRFIERTGGTKSWELEALPPEYIREELRRSIEANMDMDIYAQSIVEEQDDLMELSLVRSQLID